MKSDLLTLNFRCKNNGCGQELSYNDALKHLKDCDRALRPCVCGFGILNCDMKFHKDKQCSETKKDCLICETPIYLNRDEKHDCISVLKNNLLKS